MNPARTRALACVVAPLCAVVAMRMLAPGLGPAQAAARPIVREPAKDPAAGRTRAPDDPRLIAAVRDLLAAPVGAFTVSSPGPHIVKSPVAPAPVKQAPRPTFSLSSIAGGRQTFAVIDGKVRRAGDDLGDGWSVAEIDRASGQVRLAGPDGDSLTLTLRAER